MTERGRELHAIADRQIAGLIDLVSGLDETALRLPCPGRQRLGDGTVGASVRHTADNYQRIAAFVQRRSGGREPNHQYAADTVNVIAVTEQLSASRDILARIAEFTDSQLDAIPPKDSFRFCDGQRTLEQVLAGLLKHQSHQVGALHTALA